MTDIAASTQVGQDWLRGVPDATGGGGDARHAATSLTWMSRGACQDEDPELFFPIATQGPALSQISAARAVCRRCAVAAMCLTYALQTRQAGIWGGTTQEERRAIAKRHRPEAGEQTSHRAVPERPILPDPPADWASAAQSAGSRVAQAAREAEQSTATTVGRGPRS